MNERLQAYIDGLFRNAPQTDKIGEIKEEILQNTIDRYHDLLAEGKDEEEAYRTAIAGIGDVDDLIGSVSAKNTVPTDTSRETERIRLTRTMLLSVAVALYICCVIPPIIFDMIPGWGEAIGPVLMFVMIAMATALLIFRSGIRLPAGEYAEPDAEYAYKTHRPHKEEKGPVEKAVEGLIGCLMLVIYFVVSFATGAWYITWLIFPIGGAIRGVVHAIFDLVK